MFMKLPDCQKRFGGTYQVEKMIREGKLFRIEPGIYSDLSECSEIELLLFKYPRSVVTLQSAYYYYDLSDAIPEHYHLATDRDGWKISDPRVIQSFVPTGTINIGVTQKTVGDETIARIYDQERLLIETVRYRTKLPYDLYREVISSFRRISPELYTAKMCDYLEHFPRKDALLRVIESEVL